MDTNIIAFGLTQAANHRTPPLIGQTFIKRLDTFSKPIWLECSDNNVYVVKGQQAGRAIFNDQMVATLGRKMGAPVGSPALVIIPDELQRIEPRLQDITPGIAHGTLFINDTTDRQWISHVDKDYNRTRFALLAILYGWLCAGDHQLVYSNHEPNLVYSVDHGHFFPGGPNWTNESLAMSPGVQPYSELYNGCGLNELDINIALFALRNITDNDIIDAVGIPPDEWGVSIAERIEMVKFIMTRRDNMLATFAGVTGEQP